MTHEFLAVIMGIFSKYVVGWAIRLERPHDPARQLLRQRRHGELELRKSSSSAGRSSTRTPQRVFEYIEAFYNPQRRHSAIGYMSPAEFKRAARIIMTAWRSRFGVAGETDFYAGYEGEPEVRFAIVGADGSEEQSVRLWAGHFDALMNRAKPEDCRWTALALPYHLHAGWYDQSPWTIPDIASVVSQWQAIGVEPLDRSLAGAHAAVLELLSSAVQMGRQVVVVYE